MFLSRVALSGLEFLSSLVDEIFGCELQRRLVLKDCRVGAFQETSIRRSPDSNGSRLRIGSYGNRFIESFGYLLSWKMIPMVFRWPERRRLTP